MKIFISWSGTKSCEVAKVLKQWIPCIIQNVEPYFSSTDIDKGARWSTDISKELEIASFGILCVTNENLNSAWLNFEAGALSKKIDKSRVCPLLIDMKPSDIKDSPILQFQMTSIVKDDVFHLFDSINKCLEEKSLDDSVLQTTFDTFWPKLEESLGSLSASTGHDNSGIVLDKDNSTMEEILELVRYQHKILKNPEELLPIDYLCEIMQRINSQDKMESFEMREMSTRERERERERYINLQELRVTLKRILDVPISCIQNESATDKKDEKEPAINCRPQMKEIADLVGRALTLTERCLWL